MAASGPPRSKASGSRSAASASRGSTDPVDRVWALFASPRLALGLFLAIAALGLASVLIAQAPASLAPGSAEFAGWVESVRPRYGAWTDALAAIQFFAATRSLPINLLLGLLALSALVCTLDRAPRLLRVAWRPPEVATDAPFAAGASGLTSLSAQGSLGDAATAVRGALASRRFRTLEAQSTATYLYADRNRFAPLGTLVTHASIVVFLVGALVTSLASARVPGFIVPEGATRGVGLDTNLALRLDDFADAYYPDGTPSDYRSDVVLYDGSVEVARQTIRVNEPLVHGGIRIHQQSFGSAAALRARDEGGHVVFDDGVALTRALGGRPAGLARLPDGRFDLLVLGPGPGDPSLAPGQVRVEAWSAGESLGGDTVVVGRPGRVAGLSIDYLGERQYSAFEVVRDPGAPLIWLAGILFVSGVSAVFAFPRQVVRVRLREVTAGEVVVDIAASERWIGTSAGAEIIAAALRA